MENEEDDPGKELLDLLSRRAIRERRLRILKIELERIDKMETIRKVFEKEESSDSSSSSSSSDDDLTTAVKQKKKTNKKKKKLKTEDVIDLTADE
jgi:hypothetical protein